MSDHTENGLQKSSHLNASTKIITTVIGLLLAIAGFEHGLFEVLQGSKPTDGVIIQAIAKTMQRWKYGGEEAFTIIPNFLITGILAMGVSVFIMIWSVFLVQKKYGRTIFLLLFILLTLVGGGLGYIPFFLVTWAYATRMNKPLTWWKKILTPKIRKQASKVWPYSLTATVVCWLIVLEIAIRGYFPGQTNPETIINLNWTFLLLTMIFINLSFISGFARDMKR